MSTQEAKKQRIRDLFGAGFAIKRISETVGASVSTLYINENARYISNQEKGKNWKHKEKNGVMQFLNYSKHKFQKTQQHP